MIIDDEIFNGVVAPLCRAGVGLIENTSEFYHLVNNHEIASFIYTNKLGSAQFNFLYEILQNQELTLCPECGHYNDNIDCPIIRCEKCDFEWEVSTPSAVDVCKACDAFKLGTCEK